MALPPTQMPLPPAEIVPELLMPPENAEIVTGATMRVPLPRAGAPPSKMPLPPAEIVPVLLMPPEKVAIVTEAAREAGVPPTIIP